MGAVKPIQSKATSCAVPVCLAAAYTQICANASSFPSGCLLGKTCTLTLCCTLYSVMSKCHVAEAPMQCNVMHAYNTSCILQVAKRTRAEWHSQIKRHFSQQGAYRGIQTTKQDSQAQLSFLDQSTTTASCNTAKINR